jgi:nickel-dependent lactate racemase
MSTLRVSLDYGRSGLDVELPAERVVGTLANREPPALPDPEAEVIAKLARPTGTPPLAELARGRKNACILVCDITRPVPNPILLRPLLRTLHEAGIAPRDVLILVATGLHRHSDAAERAEMLGPEIASNYRVADWRSEGLLPCAGLVQSKNTSGFATRATRHPYLITRPAPH